MPSDSDAELLRGLRWRELRNLADRHGVLVRGLRSKFEVADALLASPSAEAIRAEIAARGGTGSAASQTGERLAATRDAIREAANLGAAVGAAEDAWKAAAQAVEEGNLAPAEEDLARASRLAAEARERRIKEIEAALSTVADHIGAAQKVGADVADAEDLRLRAADAVSSQEYVQAGELIRQAERLAIQAQLRQINRAIQLREDQIERARAIIAGCEPLLQEAESYDLSVADVRTLLRQSRDVLAKGDYLAGLTFAHNAEEAAYRLSSHVEEERTRRGIARPAPGLCGACGSGHLLFFEDGWGRCSDCDVEFRWRGALGLRERLRGLLGV
ncbi:MAG TPA: hypothetical protein VEY12_11020 [Thermoplasmata archaeon]|nr:hypothetical protein [Thermoplasmata archaeon]